MIDLYLKFPDQEVSIPLLYNTSTDSAGVTQYIPKFRAIDVLGIIYEPVVLPVDPEAPLPEPVPLPGWHVNVRVCDDESDSQLLEYVVHPEFPRRVWF
jgi:hypothetical protein